MMDEQTWPGELETKLEQAEHEIDVLCRELRDCEDRLLDTQSVQGLHDLPEEMHDVDVDDVYNLLDNLFNISMWFIRREEQQASKTVWIAEQLLVQLEEARDVKMQLMQGKIDLLEKMLREEREQKEMVREERDRLEVRIQKHRRQ